MQLSKKKAKKTTRPKPHVFLSRIKNGKRTNKTNDQEAEHKPAVHTHGRRKQTHRRDGKKRTK